MLSGLVASIHPIVTRLLLSCVQAKGTVAPLLAPELAPKRGRATMREGDDAHGCMHRCCAMGVRKDSPRVMTSLVVGEKDRSDGTTMAFLLGPTVRCCEVQHLSCLSSSLHNVATLHCLQQHCVSFCRQNYATYAYNNLNLRNDGKRL